MAADIYTSAGEAYVIDALDTALGSGAAVACGVGSADATKASTGLGDTTGCPTRANGGSVTKTQPAADTLRIVKTIAFTSSLSIREVGLFADTTSGPMIQHHTFTAIPVGDGDSIEFTIEHQQA